MCYNEFIAKGLFVRYPTLDERLSPNYLNPVVPSTAKPLEHNGYFSEMISLLISNMKVK